MHNTSPRPLLVRFGALGDMVILTVGIRALAERFGMPVDIMASGPWTRPLLQGQPWVGDIHVIHSRSTPYLFSQEQRRMVAALGKRGRSPTWIGETNDEKVRWLLHRAGWQPSDLCGVNDLQPVGGEHYCDHLLRLANLSPASASPANTPSAWQRPHYSLAVSAALQAETQKFLDAKHLRDVPLLLIQAGNKRTMKRFGSRQRTTNTKYWPEHHWATVISALRDMHPDHAILLMGVPQESELNDDIIRLAGIRNVHNFARENSVPLLMALAQRAIGMISVDTGPGHVAAAVNCRLVTLFGTTDPRFYVPRGPQRDAIAVVGWVNDQQSMLGITPAQVIAAWQQALRD